MPSRHAMRIRFLLGLHTALTGIEREPAQPPNIEFETQLGVGLETLAGGILLAEAPKLERVALAGHLHDALSYSCAAAWSNLQNLS